MIASLDGGTSAGGLSGALGGPADKVVFAALRAAADVILVGAGTMRAEKYGPARVAPAARERRTAIGLSPTPPIAVLTSSCRLDWDLPFFTDAESRPLVVTTAMAEPDDRARAAEAASVVVAGEQRVDLARALAELAALGFSAVLAEGGPTILGQLAARGLIDELCLTLSPTLVGGEASRILDGAVLESILNADLAHVLESDGFLFLRYAVGSAPR